MAKFSGQITLAEVQKGERGTGIKNIVSWYQIFSVGIKPTLNNIDKDTFKAQNSEVYDDPRYNWTTTPTLPSDSGKYLWCLQEIIYETNGSETVNPTQLTEPVICGNAVTAVKNEYSVDGRLEGTWDKEYSAGVHHYIRFSYDGGNNWTTPIKIVGLDGVTTATTVYSIVSDYSEVLKFIATKESESDSTYEFAPHQIHFSLKKSSSTSDTVEPIYIPTNFREEPIPSEEIDKENRGSLYSHLTIKFLSKQNQITDGTGTDYWAGVDLELYKDAFYDYINGEESEPQLMLDLKKLSKLVSDKVEGNGGSKINEIFSEETLIRFELGYWDLVTTEAADGTLIYEERKQTFFTFIPIRFAMNKDLAQFSVNAHDIHMSIAQAGLTFDGQGLHVQNGAFEIIREVNGQPEVILGADLFGNLKVKGHIEATSGTFNGTVYADNGNFKGSVYASRGTLGLLDITDALRIENLDNSGTSIDIGRYSYSEVTGPIDEELIQANNWYIFSETDNAFVKYDGKGYNKNSTIVYRRKEIGGIRSSNYSSDESRGFFIAADGTIHANELYIGSNAEIENSLRIGDNCYILNPKQNNSDFIKIIDTEKGTTPFKIDSTGKMTLGRIIFDGTTSSISSDGLLTASQSWSITPERAVFNNIVARGSIEASVFKYGEVTAVGGIILARPASKIKSINMDENGTVIFDKEKGVEITLEDGAGFSEGADDEENKGYCLFTSRQGLTKIYLKVTEIVTDLTSTALDFKDFRIKVISESTEWTAENYKELLNETLVYIGRTAQYEKEEDSKGELVNTNLLREGSIGICINGSDDSASFTTPRAITVYTLGENYDERNSRIILGQIPNDPNFGRIAGSYGLYGENVYLKGALVTETPSSKPVFSGISTAYSDNEDIPTLEGFHNEFPNAKGLGKILMWAGAEANTKSAIENAKFKVDEYGNMYAGSGYFNGSILTNATIEAAKIRTAIIEGTGDEENYGLVIRDMRKGIQFTQSEVDSAGQPIYEEDGITPLVTTLFSLTSEGITANIKLSVKELELTGTSPLSLKKISFVENNAGLGIKHNYLAFWNNQNSKVGYWRMESDGLGFYYNGQLALNDEISNDWENLTQKTLLKTVSFGQNVVIGNQNASPPPELIIWGGITMGETAQITRIDNGTNSGFDINIL